MARPTANTKQKQQKRNAAKAEPPISAAEHKEALAKLTALHAELAAERAKRVAADATSAAERAKRVIAENALRSGARRLMAARGAQRNAQQKCSTLQHKLKQSRKAVAAAKGGARSPRKRSYVSAKARVMDERVAELERTNAALTLQVAHCREDRRDLCRRSHKKYVDPARPRGRPRKILRTRPECEATRMRRELKEQHPNLEFTASNVKMLRAKFPEMTTGFIEHFFDVSPRRARQAFDCDPITPSRAEQVSERREARADAIDELLQFPTVDSLPVLHRRLKKEHDVSMGFRQFRELMRDRHFVVRVRQRNTPMLTDEHKARRVRFARAFLRHLDEQPDGGLNYLRHILWTDEVAVKDGCASPTCVRVSKKRAKCKAVKRELAATQNVPRAKVPAKVTVWLGVCAAALDASEPMFCGPAFPLDYTGDGVQENMTKVIYEDVVRTHVRPFVSRAGDHDATPIIFQQDNLPAHNAGYKWLGEHGVAGLKFRDADGVDVGWPPQSPDLNIIENVWAQLKRELDAVKRESGPLKGAAELKKAMERLLKEERVQRRVGEMVAAACASYRARLQAVIDAGGCATRW